MKRVMCGSVCVLFIAGFYFVVGINAARHELRMTSSQSNYPQQKPSFIEANRHGTLRVIRNREGKVLFDEKRPADEGFAFGYQVLDANGKPKRNTPPRIIAAVNDTFSEKLLICPECQKRNATMAVTSGDTSDKVLRINTTYTFDEKTGAIKVQRALFNISKYPVRLLYAQVQYDAKLRGKDQANSTRFSFIKDFKPSASPRSSTASFGKNWMPAPTFFDRVFPLPCEVCPPWCDFNLERLNSSDGFFCPTCEGESKLIWDVFHHQGAPPANCVNPIKLDVMSNGYIEVSQSGKTFTLRDGMKVCVECLTDATTGALLPVIVGSVGTENLRCKQYTLSNGPVKGSPAAPAPALAEITTGQGALMETEMATEGITP